MRISDWSSDVCSSDLAFIKRLLAETYQMKIVVLDGYALNPGDLSWKGFENLGSLIVYDRTSPEEIVSRAADADAILTNKVPVRTGVIKQLPQLKYIGVLATGYNIIDIDAASAQNVIVCNIPDYGSYSV